jgi:hypothetical protein
MHCGTAHEHMILTGIACLFHVNAAAYIQGILQHSSFGISHQLSHSILLLLVILMLSLQGMTNVEPVAQVEDLKPKYVISDILCRQHPGSAAVVNSL